MDENKIYETKLHWVSNIRPIIEIVYGTSGFWAYLLLLTTGDIPFITDGFSLLLVPLFAISPYFFFKGLYDFIFNKRVRVYITNKQLTVKTGILSKKLVDISLSKYEGMDVYQSAIGRWLGFGTLTATTGGAVLSYKIENPMKLRKHIIETIK